VLKRQLIIYLSEEETVLQEQFKALLIMEGKPRDFSKELRPIVVAHMKKRLK